MERNQNEKANEGSNNAGNISKDRSQESIGHPPVQTPHTGYNDLQKSNSRIANARHQATGTSRSAIASSGSATSSKRSAVSFNNPNPNNSNSIQNLPPNLLFSLLSSANTSQGSSGTQNNPNQPNVNLNQPISLSRQAPMHPTVPTSTHQTPTTSMGPNSQLNNLLATLLQGTSGGGNTVSSMNTLFGHHGVINTLGSSKPSVLEEHSPRPVGGNVPSSKQTKPKQLPGRTLPSTVAPPSSIFPNTNNNDNNSSQTVVSALASLLGSIGNASAQQGTAGDSRQAHASSSQQSSELALKLLTQGRLEQLINTRQTIGGSGDHGKQAKDSLDAKSTTKVYRNVVPCRARGMPIDHNFKNAYFVLTENTKHGDQLVCSYPQCKNGGVKFRYCSTCRTPVAQRNFSKRHSHVVEEEKVSGTTSASRAAKEGPDQAVRKRSVSLSSRASKRCGGVEPKLTPGNNDTPVQPLGDETFDAKEKNFDHSRRKAWSLLLLNRPETDDEMGMSAWLMRVMAVSDSSKKVNLKAIEKAYSAPSGAGQRAKESSEGLGNSDQRNEHPLNPSTGEGMSDTVVSFKKTPFDSDESLSDSMDDEGEERKTKGNKNFEGRKPERSSTDSNVDIKERGEALNPKKKRAREAEIVSQVVTQKGEGNEKAQNDCEEGENDLQEQKRIRA